MVSYCLNIPVGLSTGKEIENNKWLLVDKTFIFSYVTPYFPSECSERVINRVDSKKRNFISTSNHVLFCLCTLLSFLLIREIDCLNERSVKGEWHVSIWLAMSNTRKVVSSHVKTELENGTLSLTGIFHSLSDPTILKVHHKTRSQQYPGFETAEGSGYGGPWQTREFEKRKVHDNCGSRCWRIRNTSGKALDIRGVWDIRGLKVRGRYGWFALKG